MKLFFDIPNSKKNQLAQGHDAKRNISARWNLGNLISGGMGGLAIEYFRSG